MYVVDFIPRGESTERVACATPKALFHVVYALEHDASIVAFCVLDGYEPRDFGWGGFSKWRRYFTTEDFKL